MPRITFTQPDGVRLQVEVPAGISLMEAARQNGVAGILALCGGACACATCHVYVDPTWMPRLPAREDMEDGMLESAWEPRPNSRLSCQIEVTTQLDGLEVTVPPHQGG
jgi:2Fe-2S ferredoxin